MRWLAALLLLACALPARADEAPTRWEQLFYPFPIVGAPPQLEQQVQVFGSYATGSAGRAFTPSAELGYIAAARLGLVADVPYQLGSGGAPSGVGDASLLVQYLVTGSLERDYMVSAGAQGQFPTGRPGITAGDYYAGPFVFAAKRWRRRYILEGNATALEPLVHGDRAKQLLLSGLASYLTTGPSSRFPLYLQVELDTTRFLSDVPPVQAVSIAPEVFLGPFKTPIDEGVRAAAGVFFNLEGQPAENRVYSVTLAFDLPNRFGY